MCKNVEIRPIKREQIKEVADERGRVHIDWIKVADVAVPIIAETGEVVSGVCGTTVYSYIDDAPMIEIEAYCYSDEGEDN